MDLIGIENEAEFFPAGALSDSLQDELRDITSRWSKAPVNPLDRLAECCEAYITGLRRIRNSTDAANRRKRRRDIANELVKALGYFYERGSLQTALAGETTVPALAKVVDEEGRDAIWLLEAPFDNLDDENADPLSLNFRPDQLADEDQEFVEIDRPIEEILGEGIFDLRHPPRLVIILGLSQIVLVDRHKWPARSVLRFDLQEIFSRQDKDTLTLMACLLSREARVPQQGLPIGDRIEEEAQRNANTVTTSLKRTVRDAIEILGQEVLDVTGGKYPSGPRQGVWIDGPELSLECLRYMYRLLFLFYAEANPRMEILNLKDPLYASGYSIEALRELESIRLRTPSEKAGTYLWDSLQRTLGLLFDARTTPLRLPTVKVSLLDPDSTPILNSIRLRNEAIQKIIRLLSLKRSRSGTARISYAKLGISQLGAVYETLISFTGVIAKQDLIELRPPKGRGTDAEDDASGGGDEETEEDDAVDESAKGDEVDLLAPSYFVARSRAGEFKKDQIVFNGPEARVYKKGSFIYRLAGRDRSKSASYYTPESLARLLVKHALAERCKDLPADEILELKILEPAMGSAAFLVEATNQLADIYLDRKQKETGDTIPQDKITIERQKVRAFIADRNCFGVDLNPVATELGEISLWLNSLHAGDFSPWFHDQLHAGNSLIGARRASFCPASLSAKKTEDLWLDQKPEEIGWRGNLPEGHVWQFLLPAADMAGFDTDRSITEFAAKAQAKIKAWRKDGFFASLEPHEIKLLQKLSRIAADLFDYVADDLAKSRLYTNDAITIWPGREMPGSRGLDFHHKDRHFSTLIGTDRGSNTLPYKRLKTAMDAWCALWLWPLDKAHLLPSRQEFLHGMTLILEGGFLPDGSITAPSLEEIRPPTRDLFGVARSDTKNRTKPASGDKQADLFRETNVDALIQEVEWLGVAAQVAERERFMHWDLVFADVLRSRGGFDVIVGNPPWARLGWNESLALGDIDPGFVTRKLSASDSRKARSAALSQTPDKKAFLDAYVSAKGAMAVTSSESMNPFAGGGRNNLYRCFVDLTFRLISSSGTIALIHQDGHLNDPKAGNFRQHWYSRIVKHFEFINRIKTKNFAEIAHYTRFSLNIYRGRACDISFEHFSSAFLASQIEDSYRHDGAGPLPTILKSDGNADTNGHLDRIVHIDMPALTAILALTEDGSTPVPKARFIQPFSAKMLNVFLAIANAPSLTDALATTGQQNGDGQDVTGATASWQMNCIWNETEAQKEGIIRRETAFRDKASKIVISGPMFHVANPLYKTPKPDCRTKADYEVIDLTLSPADYLSRTNYVPAVPLKEYFNHLPRCSWDPTRSHVDFYRVAFRRRVNLNSERSLVAAIIPPGIAHIHTVESAAFSQPNDLLDIAAAATSLIFDFLIKVTGRGDIFVSDVARFPFADFGDTAKHRSLRLACLTEDYAPLWNGNAPGLSPLPWHSDDPRLTLDGPVQGPKKWGRTAALRTEFARRMALVEIDVLVAQALGLTRDQLIDIYRIYFPIMQQYENATWYDRKGRIVWTASKGLPRVGYLEEGKSPGRKRWDEILSTNPKHLECEATINFLPGKPQRIIRKFEGPFDRCDRIADYKRAWAYFAKHRKGGKAP